MHNFGELGTGAFAGAGGLAVFFLFGYEGNSAWGARWGMGGWGCSLFKKHARFSQLEEAASAQIAR